MISINIAGGQWESPASRLGPVHFNVGTNRRARLNEHPEFEKLRGTVTMGVGDSSLLTRMWSGQDLEPVISDVHWDFVVMRPTITLDDLTICDRGRMPGFRDPGIKK